MMPDEPVRVGILTVSDRSAQGTRPDASGPALADIVRSQGWQVARMALVPDDMEYLLSILPDWADSGSFDLVLTTGGTGFSPRDLTPEATLKIVERPTPGLVEAMRYASLQVTPHAMLSRAAAGIRKRCLIVNLPGSPKAAVENLQVILPALPHAIQLLRDDPQSEAGHAAPASE
jgi:molybdopterin adenylyltransferase